MRRWQADAPLGGVIQDGAIDRDVRVDGAVVDDRVYAPQFFDPRAGAALEFAQVIKQIYSQIASQYFS